MIKTQVKEKILAKGTGIGKKLYTGTARMIKVPEQGSFNNGEILISNFTDARFIPLIARAGALLVEEGGITSHAAIVALEFGIPAIIGIPGIETAIPDGEIITVDASTGIVYEGLVSIT